MVDVDLHEYGFDTMSLAYMIQQLHGAFGFDNGGPDRRWRRIHETWDGYFWGLDWGMDEPAAGLDAEEVEQMIRHLGAVADTYDDRLAQEFGGALPSPTKGSTP